MKMNDRLILGSFELPFHDKLYPNGLVAQNIAWCNSSRSQVIIRPGQILLKTPPTLSNAPQAPYIIQPNEVLL